MGCNSSKPAVATSAPQSASTTPPVVEQRPVVVEQEAPKPEEPPKEPEPVKEPEPIKEPVKEEAPKKKKKVKVPFQGFRGEIDKDAHCGFKICPDMPFLEVSDAGQARFSLPEEALTHVPSDDAMITKFKNGDWERKIYCNTKLQDEELELLKALQDEAKAAGDPVFSSIAAAGSRYLSTARRNVQKAWTMMQASMAWRREYFSSGPLTDASVAEDIKHGIVYFAGRDYALRPLMVIRANRIPQSWYDNNQIDKIIKVLVFHMEYLARYMIYPGRVENMIALIDLNGLGLTDVPFSALKQVYGVLNNHYGGRLYRLYICNLSWTLKTLSSAVMNLVTDRQRQKLCILGDAKAMKEEFTVHFALHHLEKDLGGTREDIKEFLPFPLLPGPFDKGYNGQPKANAVPDVHKVITRAGVIGRLWNSSWSEADNKKVQYEENAAPVLRKCGAPIPPELQEDEEEEEEEEAPAPAPQEKIPAQGVQEKPKEVQSLSLPVENRSLRTTGDGIKDQAQTLVIPDSQSPFGDEDPISRNVEDSAVDANSIGICGIFNCSPVSSTK
eukprot:TRINITY_DN2870_c2_g1_i1.p1 TRINITY_DN2870_c2_g1~~TRINITY_DN2870_c2_g1_i1.p1  ORF type:complete len:556 (+),score=142.33 TRINITY_DN2870_c2_g1_i1:85-1752(+)